jgi:hypothetical protein
MNDDAEADRDQVTVVVSPPLDMDPASGSTPDFAGLLAILVPCPER